MITEEKVGKSCFMKLLFIMQQIAGGDHIQQVVVSGSES